MKYDKYIDEFMFSPEMRAYLKTVELPAHDLLDLICLSPVPLVKKMESIRILAKEAVADHDEELREECDKQLRYFEKALSYIDEEGVFTAETSWYNEILHETEDSFDTVLATIDDAKDFIRDYIRLGELKDDSLYWYDIRKWVKDDAGKYVEACSYLFIRNEISFVGIENYTPADENDFSELRSVPWGYDLNLPVPFKPGDVLQIDGFPFGPKVHFVVLDIGDNIDCCCIQVLSKGAIVKSEEALWYTGALKHYFVGYTVFPTISPLYTATALNEPENDDDRMLFRVKDFIGGDSEKSRKLLDEIRDELTDEELMEILKAYR